MVLDSYSWTIIDDQIAIKRTDLSVFKNHGSGIPIKTRFFFEIEKFKAGETREVEIEFNGNKYKGKLRRTRSTAQQTQIVWESKLSNDLNKMFPNVLKTEDYPEMRVTKIDGRHYCFSFHDIDENEIVDDSRDDYLESEIEQSDVEGKKTVIYTTKYERSAKNREDAKRIHGTKCMICGFDFEKIYGERGKDFIEVHHIKPLYSRDEEVRINPRTDLICVCSNCHRMIHRRKNNILTPDELRALINNH